jgi:amidase
VAESSGILTSREVEYTSTLDATAILQKISSSTWLAKDVMIAYCKRAAIAHQTVNCLTEICFNEAIAEATRQDKVFAETGKVIGPLHGLPISIKDHVDVAGKRSTLGYCSLAENRPEVDAVLVKALKAAGAIVFVKTTMPVTGMVFILLN